MFEIWLVGALITALVVALTYSAVLPRILKFNRQAHLTNPKHPILGHNAVGTLNGLSVLAISVGACLWPLMWLAVPTFLGSHALGLKHDKKVAVKAHAARELASTEAELHRISELIRQEHGWDQPVEDPTLPNPKALAMIERAGILDSPAQLRVESDNWHLNASNHKCRCTSYNCLDKFNEKMAVIPDVLFEETWIDGQKHIRASLADPRNLPKRRRDPSFTGWE
jgi:hypothetical protein